MRTANFVVTAAMVAGLSGTALAQSAPSPQAVTPNAPATTSSEHVDHWFASAFLGSNWGGGSDFDDVTNIDRETGSTASVNFGGEVGYVWNGMIGAEFLANYSPNFELDNVLLERRP